MGTPARPANGISRAVRNGRGRLEGLGFEAGRQTDLSDGWLRERFKKGNWSGGAIWRARVSRDPRWDANASVGILDARGRDIGYLWGRRAGRTRRGTHRASASSEARGTRSGRSPPCPPAGCPRRGPGAALPSCPAAHHSRNVHLRGFLRVTAAACCAECTIWGARQRVFLGKRRTCDDVQQLLFHDPLDSALSRRAVSRVPTVARASSAASSLPHTRPSRAARRARPGRDIISPWLGAPVLACSRRT